MSNGQPNTRYHAEIKLTLDAREVRINIFADTLVEIYRDLANISEQIPGPIQNGGHREITNAELKAAQLQRDGKLPDRVAKKLGPARSANSDTRPACVNCGSHNTELIKWVDKETGEPRQAWKCQDCKQWLPNAKKA
ncbi:MAG: hypothetical protein WBH01_08490 [Dehalococcoidia bacterium]